MALILNIETATDICSAALSKEGKVLSYKETNDPNSHSLLLGQFIQEILKENQLDFNQLEAVAVSSGPGSYTGLRIGVSMAKGLCYGLNIPLIALPTLESMANGILRYCDKSKLLAPMIDAGRMEVYSAVFDYSLQRLESEKPNIITETSYSEYLNSKEIIFFGNGSEKCKEIITSPNAIFLSEGLPSAISMASLAEQYFKDNKFADTAYFEPMYLKEFQAKISKVKGLN